MRASSILIRSMDGKIYKVTDLLQGKKIPLTETDLKDYDMHAASGVIKDLNGDLLDLATIYANSSKIEISDSLPENPKSDALYIDKTAKTLMLFDEDTSEWISLGGRENGLSPENALTEIDIYEIMNVFTTFNIKTKGEI